MGAVRYHEQGSSWWPVIWTPGIAVIGGLVDVLTGEPSYTIGWALGGLAMLAGVLLVVPAKRRFTSVEITDDTARFGEEVLPVDEIAEVPDEGRDAIGARMLGGGWVSPRGTEEVALTLRDGRTVRGFARDPEALRTALRAVVRGAAVDPDQPSRQDQAPTRDPEAAPDHD